MSVAALAAERFGVLSLDELRACGLSRDAVASRVRAGRLHPVHRGVYAVGHPALPIEGRWLAAVKACGAGAVLSHRSAAALWGFLEPDDRPPEVTVPGTSTRRHAGVRVHRTARLDGADLARHRGIAVTAPARTVLDLAAVLDGRPLRRAVRHAQSLHRVNVAGLVEVLARLGPCRGSRRLARLVATGPASTRSELEDVVLDLMLRGGLAHPRVNAPLALGGRRVVPDFRRPAERQALLETHGERVLRVTWAQAVGEPGRTLARLRGAGAPCAGPIADAMLRSTRAREAEEERCAHASRRSS